MVFKKLNGGTRDRAGTGCEWEKKGSREKGPIKRIAKKIDKIVWDKKSTVLVCKAPKPTSN